MLPRDDLALNYSFLPARGRGVYMQRISIGRPTLVNGGASGFSAVDL